MKDGGREILFTSAILQEQSGKHWLDIKAKVSEKEVQFLEWKHIMNSLRKFNNKISQGESLLTMEEDELFLSIEKLITEKYGSEVWQTQTKKKS